MDREDMCNALHKLFVDENRFDALEQGEYLPGDMVAVRTRAIVHGVIEVYDDSLLLTDGQSEFSVARNDVRPATEYAPAMHAFLQLPGKITVDRKGHVVSEKPIRFIHDEWV